MNSPKTLLCDGCGQPASPEHLAARLQRLEWATRYRPVHIGVLFLGAASPAAAGDYLYAGAGEDAQAAAVGALNGEGRHLLSATGLLAMAQASGRAAALAEFQHRGYFLTHILECPSKVPGGPGSAEIEGQVPLVLARIRRSLRPKRIALIAHGLDALLARFAASELGVTWVLDGGKAFALDGADPAAATARLREALAGNAGGIR
ncbi:MAG: hypothetical protein LAN84_17580 [Acidobacteriia bacterium]|nr:hypothetical protein [Terriglobia bacterium]